MFLARKVASIEEEKIADDILKQYDIKDEINYQGVKYVMEIEKKIVGVTKVDFYENIGVLKYVAIDKSEVGDELGDALLRAVFNYAISNGIDKIYFPTENSYLLKFGFKQKKNCLNINGEEKEFSIQLELEPFFTAPCKGSQYI